MSAEQGKMSFLEHLEELRSRLIRCALAVVAGMIVCWFFREDILAFLEAPLIDAWSKVEGLPPPQPLNFSGMLEPFIAYLKLSAVGGVFLASPVLLFNLWRFVSPGLYPKERKVALPFVLVSTLLFVGGSLSAYYVVFPIGFRFFLEFASGTEVDTVEAQVLIAGPWPVPPADESMDDPQDRGPEEPRSLVAAAASLRDAGAGDAGPEMEPDAGTVDYLDAGYGEEESSNAGAEPPVRVDEAETESGSVSERESSVEQDEAIDPEGDEESSEKAVDEPGGDESVSQPEEESSWYEWLLFKFVKSNCRELEAEADERQVVLRFVWHERECGAFPQIMRVNRNEKRLAEVEWSEPLARPGGMSHSETIDDHPGPGTHIYEVGFSAAASERTKLAPVLMVKDFLSFAIRLILAFGIIFELPVLISFLAIAGIVNYRQLLRFSRWFFVIAVILGAVLTPPDIITQVLLAIPLMVLYFLSVLVARIFGPKPDDI